jgi:hypothetical protein
MSIVRHGHKMQPFTSTPCQAYPPREKPFSPEEEALLDEEILVMLNKQAIEPVYMYNNYYGIDTL